MSETAPVEPSSDLRPPTKSMSALYRRALVDLVVIAAVVFAAYFVVSDLDLFERLNDFSRSHEDWELDELIVAVLLSTIGVYAFGIRRIMDQRREIKIRQRAEHDAHRLAQVDPLTSLANRRHFEERLTAGLATIARRGGGLALLMIDLDRFKPINDVFGHATGDQILVAFARRASGLLGPNGLLARVGGDEFAAVIHPLSSDEEACRLARQLLALFDNPLETSTGARVSAGCSIGIAIAPRDGTSADALIRRADSALYRAKDGGRRNYSLFEAGMDVDKERRATIEADLHDAIADGSIQPFYQPIVDLRSREITGFEALARWHHPTLGHIPPGEFMKVAEDSGRAVQLSVHLLRRACRDALAWPRTVRLSFNLSRAQLADPTVVLKIIGILGETGLNPQRLEIEISETALTGAGAAAREALATFHQAGIRVALDDFGAGNAGINQLRQVRFDRLKIDESLIDSLIDSKDDHAFVHAFLGLGRALKIPVTAKGVDREDVLPRLVEEGCSEGQGYAFGRAVPAEEVSKYIGIHPSRNEAV